MTLAEKKRILAFSSIGCIVSYLYKDAPGTPHDVHHLTQGGRRHGDLYTIPLSPWYHRGVPNEGVSQKKMTELYGPSLAKNKKAFVKEFGSESFLLDRVNELLGG
jgi:hypothetical protein